MISNVIKKLEKLDKVLDREYRKLKPKARNAEIKSFFLLRHWNAGKLTPVQRYIIRDWEPRVSNLIHLLSMPEYEKFRNWLGINRLKRVDQWPSEKKRQYPDYIYETKIYCDLRDGVKESVTSSTS